MKKKFEFDPSQKIEVAGALEELKNDTLNALSAELVMGGSTNADDWIKTTEWVKAFDVV